MKIVQVVAYYPPHIGGMENCVKEISDRLALKGHQVEIFTSDIGCKKRRRSSTDNLHIHYLRSWEMAHTAIIPSLFFKLLKIPKDFIMHVHIAQVFIPEIVFLISKIRKIPYIAHIHADVEPSGKMGFLLPFYKKMFLQKILNSALKIIVPTEDYISIIGKKYTISETKIYEVPNGVEQKYFKSMSTKLQSPIRLLSVGRLCKQKNIPLLIQSFKLVIEKNHWNAELHIVGEGEEKNNILNLIKKEKLEKKVLLHGTLRGKDLYSIYSSSDIFILTSRYESFGIVLIEAMASGLPIVASNIISVKNIIKNNITGLLVEQTPKDFAKAVEKLIGNSKLREKLIKNGLEEVKKYDWNKIVQKFECIYSEAVYENNKSSNTVKIKNWM
ncbi:MAG: glycosyltransferase family 4 protein [Actinobacteria bacterium]|nr:glycosyltransferase family 4 protein [Actinomycetota bacterium]